jgi:hypothetical protein
MLAALSSHLSLQFSDLQEHVPITSARLMEEVPSTLASANSRRTEARPRHSGASLRN